MKPHLIVKLKRGVAAPELPDWVGNLRRKSPAPGSLEPAVDGLLKRFSLPVEVTREYAPTRSGKWSPEEIESGLDRTYRLILRRDTRLPDDLIDSVQLIPAVESARAGMVASAPIPRGTSRAAGKHTDLRSRQAVRLPEAHRRSRGDPAITVAVLDTGVSTEHPEYRSALLRGYDIIDGAGKFIGDYLGADPVPADQWVGHGSHVTGILAASGWRMPAGVVPECKVLPIRVLGAMKQGGRYLGAGLVDNINRAVKYAVDRGAQVINMSLGVEHRGGGLPHEEVVSYARKKGVTVVAAAGNDGCQQIYYPSGHPHVITVGAVDPAGRVAQFSTYGDHVDFVAPGTDIYSTSLGDGYAFASGTSQAAPMVAGAAALLLSYARSRPQPPRYPDQARPQA